MKKYHQGTKGSNRKRYRNNKKIRKSNTKIKAKRRDFAE